MQKTILSKRLSSDISHDKNRPWQAVTYGITMLSLAFFVLLIWLVWVMFLQQPAGEEKKEKEKPSPRSRHTLPRFEKK